MTVADSEQASQIVVFGLVLATFAAGASCFMWDARNEQEKRFAAALALFSRTFDRWGGFWGRLTQ